MEQLNSAQLLKLYFDYVCYRDSVDKPISVKAFFAANKGEYCE